MNTATMILITALIPSQGAGARAARSAEHRHQVEMGIDPVKGAGRQTPRPVASPAQHDGSMHHPDPSAQAREARQESREIKALSPEQIDQLLGGHGMGLALAAELNHYPGPKHVLELGGKLGLSAEQTARVEALRAAMSDEAVRLGKQIVEQERALDRRFSSGRIDRTELRRLTGDIARLYGELRAAHLGAHLDVRALLSTHQTHLYDELRGYSAQTIGVR
jgi:hypothetical protein